MVIGYTLVFTSTVILNFIDLSSQFDFLPNGEPLTGVPRRESSSSDTNLSPDRSFFPARPDTPAEPAFRGRSMSPYARLIAPPTRIDSSEGLQYDLGHLDSIRLTSNVNSRRIFELRRYTFPADKKVRLLVGRNGYERMPTQEQIVLSTANGDIFGILVRRNVFAGIYSSRGSRTGNMRAKINMESGDITRLTKEEVQEIPVGRNNQILRYFRVERVDHNRPEH